MSDFSLFFFNFAKAIMNMTLTTYDKTDPISIFEYAKPLIGHTLRELVGDDAINEFISKNKSQNKGELGQMVEELYYHYKPNSSPEPDFEEAGVELKTTGLKKLKDLSLQIKERLVIDMINYEEIIKETFEMSLFYRKFRLMLLLFYLYKKGVEQFDRCFLYVVLWRIPEKDLLIIKHDFEVIVEKIRRGEAHLLSEGDTEYLGACRKGQKGDSLRKQPNSEIGAPRRAFSLKPSYMRTVLEYVKSSKEDAVVNFKYQVKDSQLVGASELKKRSFEDIILQKFDDYKSKSFVDICTSLGVNFEKSKNKYALIASRIVMGKSGNVNLTEEFKKAGLQLKTIRIEENGRIREAMSFENINYQEVYETDDWYDSRLYEIFSGRFLFVIFRADGTTFSYRDKNNELKQEKSYKLETAFFWTMPQNDLEVAEEYWNHIRKTIIENQIDPRHFNSIKSSRFHVRPKATTAKDRTENPNGGLVKKYCYWFNNNYVTEIVNNNVKE